MKDTAIIKMKPAADKTMKENLISPDGKKEYVLVMEIYGENAAGKSNVIHALFLTREMICGSYVKPLKGTELINEPFAFIASEIYSTELDVILQQVSIRDKG